MTLTIPTCPAHTFSNTSFDPDKRAVSETEALKSRLDQLAGFAVECGLNPDDKLHAALVLGLQNAHIAVTRAYWSALANCASPMITGPAKFPVARAQKARNRADKHGQTVIHHLNRCLAKIERIAFPFGRDGDPIRANDPDAVQKLEAKLADVKEDHERLKKANAILRRLSDADAIPTELEKLGFSPNEIRHLVEQKIRTGVASVYLTNSRARITATESRLTALRASKEKPSDEQTISGVRVIRNREAQRLQLIFPGKPAPGVIAVLKRHAFKWSPRNTAWQRVLTNNAIYAAREVLRTVGGE